MAANRKLRVAVAGLQFGNNFLPAYLAHPEVEAVGICDVDEATLGRIGDQYGIQQRHKDLREVIASRDYDAVNLFTPIPQHADQAVATMEAGKACASAVPMATTLEDCRRIIDACRRTGRTYMMMETSLANDEFWHVHRLHEMGRFGRIQFLRGVWYHNLENHPRYWMGLPPMHYITHPVSPMLALAGQRATKVSCFGSGVMRQELVDNYGNPFPVETAVFELEDRLAMQVTSIVFHTAVQPKETFDLFGEKASFTWGAYWGDPHALVEMYPPMPGGPKSSPRAIHTFEAPSAAERLPEPLRRVGRGPYPHLVHEFVMSLVGGTRPRIDEIAAATYTAPGLCAHASAMAGGKLIEVPALG